MGLGHVRAATAATVALLAATLSAEAVAAPPQVTVRRDAVGVPHVLAKDWRGLGYGLARAAAEDTMCVLADVYLTVDGERSRFLGPDATYPIRNTGTTPRNDNSDFFWQKVKADKRVEQLVAQEPPLGPKPEVKEVVRGFAEGYNAQLAAMGGRDGVRDPECKGKPWVREIDEWDVWRRFFQLAELASAMAVLDGVGGAQPPTPDVGGAARTAQVDPLEAARALAPGEVDRRLHERGPGSNAVALGGAATQDGRGQLLGNPHQPWLGAERFYQSHLTIPGKIDVSGGSLFGSPAINIGFNKDLAWSHTVSTARRFAIYEHTLVPGSPTTYLVDGQPREMTRTRVSIQARRPDGSLETRTRTLYETVHGPVTTSVVGLPIFPWTPAKAFSIFDANRENFGRLINHFLDTNRARSVDELQTILRKYLGIPWVNTIAADRAGKALYADVGSTPGVTEQRRTQCSTAVGAALDAAQRLQVLDGSRSACDPVTGPGAPAKGILGPDQLPILVRDDYVTNSNDSHWASNPRRLLEGFPRVVGEERTVRSLRTRLGLKMVEEGIAGGGRFTAAELRDLLLNNRQHAWELWKDELLPMCDADQPDAVCAALRRYNGRDDVESRGAHLFRRFVANAIGATPSPYRVPFDPADPVGTPRGLNTENPQVRQALTQAVEDLRGAGIPLDAKLGDFQWDTFHGPRIPIGGGPQNLGLFNHLGVVWDPKEGWSRVREGATYVQVVGFSDGQSCPVQAQTLLGHSQSTDTTSPYFAEGTKRLARKQWTPQPFCAADVRRGTRLQAHFGGGAEAGIVRGLSVRRVRGGAVRVRFRLDDRARVVVRALRGTRVVRRVAVTRAAGVRTVTLRRIGSGPLQVRVRASGDGRARSVARRLRR
jgi:acyl-homoserine-lactone acylase